MKMAASVSRRSNTILFTLAAVGFLSGCATGNPVPAFIPHESPDRAEVTFFRQHHFVGSALDARVAIDGKAVGELQDGEVLVAKAAPGELKVEIKSDLDFGSLTIPLHTDPGGDYFIEVMPESLTVGLPTGGFITMPREKGPVRACNFNWCIAELSAEDAKAKMRKHSGGQ